MAKSTVADVEVTKSVKTRAPIIPMEAFVVSDAPIVNQSSATFAYDAVVTAAHEDRKTRSVQVTDAMGANLLLKLREAAKRLFNESVQHGWGDPATSSEDARQFSFRIVAIAPITRERKPKA